jgi:autotransporter-associated beta strand protein
MKTKLLITLSLTVVTQAYAGSAAWKLTPASGQWAKANNWTPATVPNGATDVATFGVSNTTAISVDTAIEVNNIVFNPGASGFTITSLSDVVGANVLTISGTGITNNSGIEQNFVAAATATFDVGEIHFTGSANAGNETVYTASINPFGSSTVIRFFDTASAGSGTFVLEGPVPGGSGSGSTVFAGSSTAANGTFENSGDINFLDNSTAADATFDNDLGFLSFEGNSSLGNAVITQRYSNLTIGDSATAANATIILKGDNQGFGAGGIAFIGGDAANASFILEGGFADGGTGSVVEFDGGAAGDANFNVAGGAVEGAFGAQVGFFLTASGGNSTITLNGGAVAGAGGAGVTFSSDGQGSNNCNAENAHIIANGGVANGDGPRIRLDGNSLGGTARIEVFGNSSLDISGRDTSTKVAIGSLEGDGLVFLGSFTLKTGANDLDTVFSGTLQDGGLFGGHGGSLTKNGSGTLTLTGSNTYTGNTALSSGALLVSNSAGSATGTGPVTVTGGTLGGKGIIAGAVTVGTGSGGEAFLAPAFESPKPVTLTLQSALTLQADATYTYTFKAKKNQSRSDLVIANGVTINAGTISLQGQIKGRLRPGTVLTVLNNTSANPISGTFSNLADGAIVNVNGNNLQASYLGGDGNDLTLTVVP